MGKGYYTVSTPQTPRLPSRHWIPASAGMANPYPIASRLPATRSWTYSSLAHAALGTGQRLDKRRPREQALGVFHQRCGRFGQLDAVIVEAPQERCDSNVEHRELFAKHVFVLGEHRRDLHQAVADQPTRLFELPLVVPFERVDVRKELFLEAMQEQPRSRTHDRVGGHQLRMRKALIDVFVDDVGFVQNQVS